MKAIIRTKYGPPDVLELRDIEKPVPRDNQVLVNVQAASVNPLDWHVLRGEPFLVRLMGFGLLKPKQQILGADFSGRVEAIGEGVTQFKVGDEVLGSSLGSFAEYACVNETKIVLKPASVSFEQGASVGVAGLTALQGLRDSGHLQAGQKVLIHGASGGVGTFAVQIAKSMGAEVTGVCSGRNVDMVRSIGADHVIDYTKADFSAGEDRYDLILDNAAFHSLRKPMRVLKPKGTYVMIGGATSNFLASMLWRLWYLATGSKKLGGFMANINQKDLLYLRDLLEAGKVVPVIDRRYSLSQVPDAIRYLETGRARGKVVITVSATP